MAEVTTGNAEDVWGPLRSSRATMLTTFRRSGEGVGTPVTMIIAGEKIYFTTWRTSGKVKRLKHTARVTMAACTQRGKVIGPSIEGTARLLSKEEEAYVRQNLFKKSLIGEIWMFIYRLRKLEPVLFEVSSVSAQNTSEVTLQ